MPVTKTRPATKSEPKTKITKETRFLKCQLTQDEILQAADELAGALDNLRKAADERESVTKTMKAAEAQFSALIATKQLLVRNKYDVRAVACTNMQDFVTMECIVTRDDTREEIVRRPLTAEEKQMSLSFDDGNGE